MKTRLPLPTAYILAMCAILLMIAAVGYRGSNSKLLGPPFGQSRGYDFLPVLRAASDIKAGNSIYARSIEFGTSPTMAKFMGWDGGALYYVYPPFLASMFVPFASLPEHAVVYVWNALNFSLLIASALMVVYLVKKVNPLKVPIWTLLAVILFLTYQPTQGVLAMGNVDILLLFLLILTYVLYRERVHLAGITLGIAVAIKPQLALLAAFFLWKRQWRLVAAAAVTGLVLMVFSFSVAGWVQLPDYMKINRIYTVGKAMRAFPLNQASFGLAMRAFSDNGYIQPLVVAPVLALLLPVIVGLLAMIVWVRSMSSSDDRQQPRNLIEYGLTLTTVMLVLPYVGHNHFLWLLLPLAALLLTSTETAFQGRTSILFSILALLLVLYVGYPDQHDAIWKGWETLAFENRPVDLRYLFFTGSLLYGLVGLDFLQALYRRALGKLAPLPQQAESDELHVLVS